MWIKTVRGEFINMDHVARFDYRAQDTITSILDYEDWRGESRSAEIYSSTTDDLDRLIYPTKFMPSPPGYDLLMYYSADENGQEIIERWPVLGWMIDEEDVYHRAVTAWTRFSESDGKDCAIACPNGHVIRPGDHCYPNVESWLEEMRRTSKKDAA